MVKTRNIFCANCQIETPHTGQVDQNGEFLFECQTEGCGRFIKLPADLPIAEFNGYFDTHKQENLGQVSVEAQEKKLTDFMDEPSDTEEEQVASSDIPQG